MIATIGIKIANGEFYSVLEEFSSKQKRLILTTAHDNQESVQIDLYKTAAKTMADAVYIGSLVVENIKPSPKREPSIELIISSNAEGEITADAKDLDAPAEGDHHHLSVSLQSLDDDSRDYNIPDFEIDSTEAPPQGLYEKASLIHENESKKKFPWMWLIIGILLLIFIVVLLFVLLGKGKSDTASSVGIIGGADGPTAVYVAESASPAENPAQTIAVPEPMPPELIPEPPKEIPIIEAAPVPPPLAETAPEISRTRPETVDDIGKNVPDAIPEEGVAYNIRWGDTLWDISEAYYRNPWLYSRIARFNGIRNPDRIISGTTIKIPPKN
jgi:hypothetical protein